MNEDLKLSCEGLLAVNETYNALLTFADNKLQGTMGYQQNFISGSGPYLGNS